MEMKFAFFFNDCFLFSSTWNPPTILIWRFIHSKHHSFKKNSFISVHCALLLLPTLYPWNRMNLHLFSLAVIFFIFAMIEAEPLRPVTKKRALQSHPITVHVDDLVY